MNTNQKMNSEKYEAYLKATHRLGRAVSLLTLVMLLGAPFLIGGLLGLVAVLAILTAIFLTDDTVTTSEDVEKVLGILPMTVIPEGNLPEAWEKAETLEEDSKPRRKRVL